jgi:hypothetical protein
MTQSKFAFLARGQEPLQALFDHCCGIIERSVLIVAGNGKRLNRV